MESNNNNLPEQTTIIGQILVLLNTIESKSLKQKLGGHFNQILSLLQTPNIDENEAAASLLNTLKEGSKKYHSKFKFSDKANIKNQYSNLLKALLNIMQNSESPVQGYKNLQDQLENTQFFGAGSVSEQITKKPKR